MRSSFLLTGSNIGDRLKNLQNCLELIKKNHRIINFSRIYESEAWGKEDQPLFLNQVIKISTFFEPKELLNSIQEIENHMGRERIEKWGTRIIDIDILFYEDLILEDTDLQIPHPGIPERRFTLSPLVELAPDLTHPVLGTTLIELLTNCTDKLKVWPFDHSAEATSASR